MTGELQFAGMIRLDGNFHGSISTSDVLVVGEHAVIHADIKVGEIEIHGQIFGNIEAKRKVEIFPTGRIRGDIHTPLLSITNGGCVDGQILMTNVVEATDNTSIISDESDASHHKN
jgi:cytoskeletal protein CcmA (bactofilin family)